jgi:hypothetical protein
MISFTPAQADMQNALYKWYAKKVWISMNTYSFFFCVEPFEDRYKVTFNTKSEREREIKLWFRERGHQARRWHGTKPGWYVKCSKDIAMLAKLTFGGDA